MARALVHSINIPSSVANERDEQFNGSQKNQTSFRMTCDVKFPSFKLKSSVGLRACNALDAKSGETLVAAETFVKGSRIVPKAMSDEAVIAQNEAMRLGHNLIGTEQILLGLITGIAAKVLKSMGINWRDDARIEVEKIIGKGHNYEHLLLELLRGGKGMAARVLENLGADDLNNIYNQVLRMVGKSNVGVAASVGGGTPGPNIFFLIWLILNKVFKC
ncbi:ATP-dependent Clp protease ATP-binding subunit ClpA homolog CD4A, chloroplastic-like [Solanum pennellii]|uniref:ATP-dependent Clp protease ATP-binding subunit ClpA homolog CD4A, chloroplastic-like n=1 Tax=Solanum pennellii TaxID=28526 RepID=A0ABM1GD63_SOLPN|nr:ATP-dependent Clp protease ATP-binding subunit ClpA homolog CD4A, chloroplastic-like [Solanum pennellii]